jgi:hypothetical protein
VEAEETIEIDRAIFETRPRDRNRRPQAVVRRFTVWHDHVQAINGATLEDRDEYPAAPAFRRRRGPCKEGWRETQGDERERAILHEHTT